MRVISTFLLAQHDPEWDKSSILFAFDTLVDEKSLVVGLTTGRVVGNSLDDAMVSPVGLKVVYRVMDHHALNYPKSNPVVFAGVQRVGNAVQRVRNLLKNAPDKSALILVCADDKVYDAAFPALNVDLKTAHPKSQ